MSDEKLRRSVVELRHTLGLTQTEFGRQLGKSLNTIQRWEGMRAPDGKALLRLVEFAARQNQENFVKVFYDAWVVWLAK